MQPDDQILRCELLHPLDQPHVFYNRLQASLAKATKMRGSVAYWTVHPHFVSAKLPQILRKSGSFLCLDIHPPTSIDLLCELVKRIEWQSGSRTRRKPSVYIHVRELEGQTEIRGANTEMPQELLHTKTLLLDLGNGLAEIWVGSHNWTRRAIVGLNIECTLVLRVSTSSPLYTQTADMLEQIRKLCQPFEPLSGQYYKWLQGKVRPKAFFELEGERASQLERTSIKLFGTERTEAASLKTIGNKICLSVRDSITDDVYLYDATVATSSEYAQDIAQLADSLHTSNQRFVFREGRRSLYLELPLPDSATNPVQHAAYGATIHIHARLPDHVQIFPLDRDELWVEVEHDPMLAELQSLVHSTAHQTGAEYRRSVREMLVNVKLRVAPGMNPALIHQLRARQSLTRSPIDDQPLFTKRIVEARPKQGKH